MNKLNFEIETYDPVLKAVDENKNYYGIYFNHDWNGSSYFTVDICQNNGERHEYRYDSLYEALDGANNWKELHG